MSKIRDASQLIAWINDGDFNTAVSAEIERVLAELKRQTYGNPKVKSKGKITLTLSFEVQGPNLTISPNFDGKVPTEPHPDAVAFVTEDGEIDTQHPRQTDMFAGPRPVRERADG